MPDPRDDSRSRTPSEAHLAVFLGGWTDAINGKLYESVTKRKTHANMGNLFGWIYGEQSREFKLEVWYRYLDRATKQEG